MAGVVIYGTDSIGKERKGSDHVVCPFYWIGDCVAGGVVLWW